MRSAPINTAVILAGGLGTRLRELGLGVPKSLVPIGGKPLLWHQITCLRRDGIEHIVLVTGHRGDLVRDAVGDGRRFGVSVEYVQETVPLGTAGCFGELRDRLPGTFVVLYGDVLFDIDFHRFTRFHRAHTGRATLLVHPNDHPGDSDLIVVDDDGVVTTIVPKGSGRIGWHHNLVNAGVFVVDRELFADLPRGRFLDLERDVLAPQVARRQIRGYRSSEYAKDVGTARRYEAARRHEATGLVAARSLRHRQRAVFLDRDGTLNRHVGLVSEPDQLEVTEQAFSALAALNESPYLAIVITNQPVVARNLCSVDGLDEIHRKLDTVLGAHGVFVDDLYYCPHHPDRGYLGENPEYKVACGCRKPATALIERAARQYRINVSESWFVGDTTSDVQTGHNAGTRTILLRTGEGGRDARYQVLADLVANDLTTAVSSLLKPTCAKVRKE